MKRAYLLAGKLVAPLLPKENVAVVDHDTWDYLDGLLGTDYCYIVIDSTEVVRVIGTVAGNTLLLARAKAITHIWPAEASITYNLTAEEVKDTVVEQTLTLTSSGVISLTDGTVDYPIVTLAAIGGISNSGNASFTLTDTQGYSCDCAGPPSIPLVYERLRIADSGYRVTDDGTYRAYA